MESSIISVRLCWRSDPIFEQRRVIEITMPIHACPNECTHDVTQCIVYGENGAVTNTLLNPINPIQIMALIITNYFPFPKDAKTSEVLVTALTTDTEISDQTYKQLCFDQPHPNIIVFKGDITDECNMHFVAQLIHITDNLGIGMFVGADSIGSEDSDRLPAILATRKIDEMQLKLYVPNELTDRTKPHIEGVLNSLTQCIAGRIHIPQGSYDSDEDGHPADIDTADLKGLMFSFLFDQHSSFDVLKECVEAIYTAIATDKDPSIFQLFNIALRGDGTEPHGFIDRVYNYIIHYGTGTLGFSAARVYCYPITYKDAKKCIYMAS